MGVKRLGKFLLWGVAVLAAIPLGLSTFLYLTRRDQPAIVIKPVELQADSRNSGTRCLPKHWDSLSESPLCYPLQERLHNAVVNNDLDEISNSLRAGANVDGTFYQSFPPLTVASMEGTLAASRLLIENGADVNTLDKWQTSNLQAALIYKHSDIAKLLLENGADVCHIARWDDGTNPTALDIAIKARDYDAMRLLISYGALFCYTQYIPDKLINSL
jgi:ankyrin repeat protein